MINRWRRVRRLSQSSWRGILWRTSPISDTWGFDRGTPIDRYYIEQFLAAHRRDVTGKVLEVAGNDYTTRFGSRISSSDILDIDPANKRATLVADLTRADQIASDQFDCFILTQTLHLIFDVRAALRHTHRMLRPGGVLLATAPVVSRISGRLGPDGEYWRFTPGAAKLLVGDVFGPGQVEVGSAGNVLSAIAFLSGLAFEELSAEELTVNDPLFPLLVSIRAVKKPLA